MKFSELRPGQRFRLSGRAVYMKTYACACQRNAVCLEDGSQVNVDQHAEVTEHHDNRDSVTGAELLSDWKTP